MYIADHGGNCCGIKHVVGFGEAFTDYRGMELDQNVEDYLEEYGNCNKDNKTTFNGLLEATLTDQQMAAGWAAELKKRGFRLVTRFKNSNSGNYVNVLHYTSHEPRGKSRTKRPFTF